MTETAIGYLLACGALVLFTTAIISTKLAASSIELGTGFMISTSTNVVFCALALCVQLLLRGTGVTFNGQAFALFAFAGGFSTYLGRWFFYESVVRFGPAKASIFQVSSPLFTALLAWLFLNEQLTAMVVVGVVMTIAGLMLVSYKPGFLTRKPAAAAPEVAPVAEDVPVAVRPTVHQRLLQSVLLLGVGSSLAYAVSSVLRGTAVRAWNEPILGALVGAVVGLALHVTFTSDRRKIIDNLKNVSRRGAWFYVLIGICTISAQTAVIASMRFIPVSVATLITLCTPLLVFPISHLLFKNQDAMGKLGLVGSALTLAGIVVIVLR